MEDSKYVLDEINKGTKMGIIKGVKLLNNYPNIDNETKNILNLSSFSI